eukprot:4535448-Pyramimonas_sp.AAC.1
MQRQRADAGLLSARFGVPEGSGSKSSFHAAFRMRASPSSDRRSDVLSARRSRRCMARPKATHRWPWAKGSARAST